ncbi:SLC13 family permease [Tuberibacillus sp. Marseille-P3662]|uniref:SLC13 family permease n=1 Tax=Tuberibacillus sp. Marseille-P3662 TaxID=1965358 RepID=UPI000A1CDDB3|nr:SLC13 family permease [Tuberibacillus sp. Marseille-P3662]
MQFPKLSASCQWFWHEHNKTKQLLLMFSSRSTEKTINEVSNNRTKQSSDDNGGYTPKQLTGLILGPLLFVLILLFFHPDDLSPGGRGILAGTIWMAVWWITEAIPIPATSLLPIAIFPLVGGLKVETVTAPYGNDTVFLFMGGFMIALAMQKWYLHKRIALAIISAIGTSTDRIILGFMVATGFLSMWISNTATSMMMMPIGLAIIYQLSDSLKEQGEDTSQGNFKFGKALMLGIAYSASVGGIGTIIGTPPNAALVGAAENLYNVEIAFAQWMLFGVPIAVIMIALIWVYLVKFAFHMSTKEMPGGKRVIHEEQDKLGTIKYEEKIVLTIFALTALAWIARSLFLDDYIPNINDATIAMIGAIILFIIPASSSKGYILDWETAVKLPWGILLLFGGGFAIAKGFQSSGLAQWIGEQLTVLNGANLLLVIFVTVLLVIFLTEITSNTATANMMFPIMGALAMALGVHPYALMIAAAVAASCAFMLPVATPPNAVVFGSGYLKIPDMAKAGVVLNIISIVLVTIFIYYLLPTMWGIDLHHIPNKFQ